MVVGAQHFRRLPLQRITLIAKQVDGTLCISQRIIDR